MHVLGCVIQQQHPAQGGCMLTRLLHAAAGFDVCSTLSAVMLVVASSSGMDSTRSQLMV